MPDPTPPETLAALREWAEAPAQSPLPPQLLLALLDERDDLAARLATSKAEVARLREAVERVEALPEVAPSFVTSRRRSYPTWEAYQLGRSEALVAVRSALSVDGGDDRG